MSTSPAFSAGTYQRARRPEQKLERRDPILAAARELALRDGVRAVSLADIAARVGIHKSALLRYFETREQIFLELTAQAWREGTAARLAGLDDAAPGSPASASAALVADVFARGFSDRPLLCDLIAHTPLNLERNVSPEAARAYKLTSLAAGGEAARMLRGVLRELPLAESTEFAAPLASLAAPQCQIANPAPALAELYASDPA